MLLYSSLDLFLVVFLVTDQHLFLLEGDPFFNPAYPLFRLNSQLRKVTKNKRVFPNDDAVFKILFLTIEYITKKWTMPLQNWNIAMAHFMIKFDGRF
jgi:putative transposase